MREDVLESFSQLATESLCKLTESVIEEHVIVLSQMRRKMITLDDPKEKKLFSSQVDALPKCIKVERTALGIPNHIVGVSIAVNDTGIDNVCCVELYSTRIVDLEGV